MDEGHDLDRFADDGGRALPDPEVEEKQRASLARLREWLVRVFADENNLHLAHDIAVKKLTAAKWARAKGRNRSSAWRQFERLFPRFHKKIMNSPQLRESMPSPWREMYLGE